MDFYKLLLFFFCTFFFYSDICAQSNNVIKTNVTTYLFRTYNIQYERRIAKRKTIQISFGGTNEYDFMSTNQEGYYLILDYKNYYYLKSDRAVYFSPYVRYQNYTYTNVEIHEHNAFGGGVIGGKVWELPRLIIDAYIGINYVNPRTVKVGQLPGHSNNPVEAPFTMGGWGPRMGLSLGFSF